MVEYIYFVKCMDCEDEPFDFFDEAKEFALGKLSKKPEIHQTEVIRNDFGECTDSTDYGKVWSWDEVMKDIPGDAEVNIFTKGDFDKYADGYNPDNDPEFDDRDITGDSALDDIPDNFRKPVPDDMTIDGLVEAMEENEEMVECKRCHELFSKEDCFYELTRGYLCTLCIMDLDAAGEDLEFRPREIPEKVIDEEPLEEEVNYESEDTEKTETSELSLIETLEESEDYKKRLVMCPECGEVSFDQETQICINCGFNVFLDEALEPDELKQITDAVQAAVDKTEKNLGGAIGQLHNKVNTLPDTKKLESEIDYLEDGSFKHQENVIKVVEREADTVLADIKRVGGILSKNDQTIYNTIK